MAEELLTHRISENFQVRPCNLFNLNFFQTWGCLIELINISYFFKDC